MPLNTDTIRAGASGAGTGEFYSTKIDQSLRLDGVNGYMDRSFTTPTSAQKMILATWIKPSEFGTKQHIFGGGSSSTTYFALSFSMTGFYNSNDDLKFLLVNGNTTIIQKITNAVFRDPTNWIHICVAIDTTQASEDNRVVFFFNGKRYSGGFSGTNHTPDQNESLPVLNANGVYHQIGLLYVGANYGYTQGYLSDYYFLDGQSIYSDTSATINSTFLADANTLNTFCIQKNGVGIPAFYTGADSTYGNNGFRLTFSNGSALGEDATTNSHDFTTYNLTATDIVKDSPSTNFPTITPINSNTNTSITEGGLNVQMGGSGNYDQFRSDFGLSSGKWYWEVYVVQRGYISSVGVSAGYKGNNVNPDHWVTFGYGGWFITYNSSLSQYQVNQNASGGTNWSGATLPVNNDVLMIALDVDNNKIWWGRNGTWYNSSGTANPATGTDSRVTLTSNQTWHPMGTLGTGGAGYTKGNLIMNFGQDSTFGGRNSSANDYSNYAGASDGNGVGSFFYTPPSGYLSCCSNNLPEITIGPNNTAQADDHFNTFLYTGTNATNRNLALNTFTPDFVWLKARSTTDNHVLIDSSRKDGSNFPNLHTNTTDAEVSDAYPKIITNGIQVSQGLYDNDGITFAVWNWKANAGTTSSNTTGDINSTVQANTDAGFSIVLYTGNGTSNADVTIGHGLTNLTPRMVIVKNRTDTDGRRWQIYHEDLSSDPTYTKKNILFTGAGESGYSSQIKAVSSTTFTVRDVDANDNKHVNKSGSNYVAYVFAEKDGFSKIGKYVGNTVSNGTYVFTGFRVAFLMLKRINSTGGWQILDNKRNTFNVVDRYLLPDLSTYERDGSTLSPAIGVDFLSNGFKLRTSETVYNNGTFIYMAFAEQPFKFSNAR